MAFNPEEERRKGRRGALESGMLGGSPLGGMLSGGGTFVPKLNPFARPPGMTLGPSMPTVDYGSGPVTELPGNILGPGGTLDPDRFGEKVWLDPWSWHYKPVKNQDAPGWLNPVLKPTMPGWEEGTYLESGKPAMQGDPHMGQNWIQYITDDPASPYYQPPFGGIQQPGEVYMEGALPPSLPGGLLAGMNWDSVGTPPPGLLGPLPGES